MDEISNRNLSLANIPTPDADWIAISAFAHTFDGYEHCGSFERCAEIGNARQPTTLTELRVCLFFEARRWHHFDSFPTGDELAYIRTLLARVREKVNARELE
jgi:hypothetical protein